MGCSCAKSTEVSVPQGTSSAGGGGGGASSSSKQPSAKPLSKDILEKKVKQAQSTRVLALRECGLKALPAAVTSADGSTFRTVDLCLNQISSLHSVVGTWKGVQNFLCSQNSLTELPLEVGELESLQKFILSQNQLRTLPPQMANLGKLKILQLEDNKLGPKLPDVFGEALAGCLEELDLSGNALKELAPSLASCGQLTRLVLAKNELELLPEGFGTELSKLRYLDAADNQLLGVPPPLLDRTELSELWLKGNPMERLRLQETPGFEKFMERRKLRLDQKIDSHVVGEVNLAVCGLD